MTEPANDLSDPSPPEEAQALTANAVAIADFVNSGGGLLAHGSEYGWLSALLPGLNSVNSGESGGLTLTPEGRAAFPGLTEDDLNAGPCHSHFEGNLGGLRVLVRYNNPTDPNDPLNGVPVVIGGAAVRLPGTPEAPQAPVVVQPAAIAPAPAAPRPAALALDPAPHVHPARAVEPKLPVTGANAQALAPVGLALVVGGVALLGAAPRRRGLHALGR